MEVLRIPTMPPTSPYDAYLWLLVIPFVLRLVLLLPPILDLIGTYAPAGSRTKNVKWFWGMLRKLPIRGFWFLVANEVLALFLPLIVALYARLIFDPVGWPSWDAMPAWGAPALLAAGISWILVDSWRVLRSRERIVHLARQNLRVAKIAVAGLVTGRSFLDRLRRVRIEVPEAGSEEANPLPKGDVGAAISRLGKLVGDAPKAVGAKMTQGAAEVADSALEGVRLLAGRMVGSIDEKIDETVQAQTRAAIVALIRDVAMALGPIVVLVALHQYV